MAQSVEQFTRNEQVISSNLITSSKKYARSNYEHIFLSIAKATVYIRFELIRFADTN